MASGFPFRVALAVAVALGMAGCSTTTGHAQAQGASAVQAATTSDSLAETNWRLARWVAADGSARELPQDPQPISIAFLAQNRDYRVSGFSGCNRYMGSYRLEGGKLIVTVPAATRMACASAGMADLERAYLASLGRISTFTLDSAGAPRQMTLNLRDGGVMFFTRQEDVPTRL
jgi:heat shock protein HslJ